MKRLLAFLLLCLSLVAVHDASAQAKAPLRTAVKQPVIRRFFVGKTPYLAMDDVAKLYGLNKSQSKKDYKYFSKYTVFAFTPDSRQATLNGTKLTLAFAPTVVQKNVVVSQADFNFYLEPIVRPRLIPRRNVKKIVIDAGHGGKDPGCKGGTVLEKDINLSVAIKLALLLAKRGYSVAMTRTSDIYLTLQQRVALAAKFKPDLFVSLHCNAASAATRGIEVYCATPQNTPASDAKVVSTKACKADPFAKQSAYAAYRMQKSLCTTLKLADRGVKHKRYTVIADLPAPCILVEMGFLSNATDRTLLGTPAHQTKLATAAANAVDAYKTILAPPKPKTTIVKH